MRIGVHTGKVVAGIIGSKVVRYDIFGEGVLIANKMESNGVPGKVCVSEETKGFLVGSEWEHDYQFERHTVFTLAAVGTEKEKLLGGKEITSWTVTPAEENSGAAGSIASGHRDKSLGGSSRGYSDDSGNAAEKSPNNSSLHDVGFLN